MVSYVRIIHICPKTNSPGKIFPHSFIFPYAFLTFADKRIQTIFFDLLFSVQSQKLFHFQLYRKPVGIPACFSRYHIALHRFISWNHVFDDTGQHMADMGLSVGCGRSVIEGIGFSFFSVFHALSENIIIFPELFRFLFSLNEIEICGNFFVHDNSPFLII